MLTNGHYIVIDLAVRHLADPLVTRYARTLVLGAFREDTGYVPILGIPYPYLSVTHFYRPGLPGGLVPFLTAGPRLRIEHFFRRGVKAWRRGRCAAAFLEVGRAMHLLVDMACPTHAQRVIHTSDPYEWYVDAHAPELSRLPVPEVVPPARPADLVASLAAFTQGYPADRTHNGWGHVMWRLGRWSRPDREACRAQAEAIIPVAAGHAVALLRLFRAATADVRHPGTAAA